MQMKRRTLLQLGLGAGAVMAVAGGAAVLLRAGVEQGRLTPAGQVVFRAVARGVLDGSLPTAPGPQADALANHLLRLDTTIGALPGPVRDELSQLLGLLSTTVGRVALAGLATDWPDASVAQLQAALQSMRTSSLTLRMQAYHALRDLTNAAYFSDAAHWPALGYPGPVAV